MKRFKYALQGLNTIVKKDWKFTIHLCCAAMAILLGIFVGINKVEWLFLIIAISLVLAFEAINTAVEYVVDLCTKEYNILAKYAKDIAAFSVLIVSVMSLIIGLIIFIPHLLAL